MRTGSSEMSNGTATYDFHAGSRFGSKVYMMIASQSWRRPYAARIGIPSLAQSLGNGGFVSLTVYGLPAIAVRDSCTTVEGSGSFTRGVFTGGGEPGCCQYT